MNKSAAYTVTHVNVHMHTHTHTHTHTYKHNLQKTDQQNKSTVNNDVTGQ